MVDLQRGLPSQLAWATDLHLNFVNLPEFDAFTDQVKRSAAAALLISGDISESEDLQWQLERLRDAVDLPLYFVLGNHDFYHGSIARTRARLTNFFSGDGDIHYLTGDRPIFTGKGWCLCGDDGWGDGRAGDYEASPIFLNDFLLIEELAGLDSQEAYRVIRREGAAVAWRLSRQLRRAARLAQQIIVMLHVPPFRESCWHEGQQTDDNWAPFFVCGAAGWYLRRFCRSHPDHQVLVLCGHTHSGGRARILPNLTVWTAGAEYGRPRIAELIDLSSLDRRLQREDADWTYA